MIKTGANMPSADNAVIYGKEGATNLKTNNIGKISTSKSALRLSAHRYLPYYKISSDIMTKNFFIIIVWIAFNGCINYNIAQTKQNLSPGLTKEINQLADTVFVKKWLTKVITEYVNSEDLKLADKNLQEVLTADYYNYKIDAITLEYSEMTYEEFQDKWKSKYDTRYVGKGGFFTSIMDNGNVEISLCKLLKTQGDMKAPPKTVAIINRVNR